MTITIKKAAIAVAVSTALGVCGLRSNWGPITYRPGPNSTAYFVNGNRAVKQTIGGKRMCIYMDDIMLPAENDICPDIVLRHLATVDIYYDGKTCNTTCGYDRNNMYLGEMQVFDRKSCPDILVTLVGAGRLDVVQSLYLDFGDRAWMYYDTTKTFTWELETDEVYIKHCMDDRYRKQLDFYELFSDRAPKASFSR